MVMLGVIVQFHPMGPRELEARVLHGAVLASAGAVGLWWLVRPWPGYRSAIAFVAWADLSVILDAALTSTPQARLLATVHLGLIGVFAAFLLGWAVLLAHCAIATAAIAAFTVWAGSSDPIALFDLYIYYAPALSSVVLLPIVIQVVIEAGRRSIDQIASQAARDPLTGLFNRRGMYAASAAKTMTMHAPGTVIAAAVIDVDRFKRLNDGYGHSIGDSALRLVAQNLLTTIGPSDIAARTGGDEFVVIIYLEDEAGVDGFIERCGSLLLDYAEGVAVSTSIGVAWETLNASRFLLDTLLTRADAAMYEAKRRGGSMLVQHEI